jgi:alpha,alpha-trehalose-phosphate synthase [UDP-forming]/trehalose-phosphatase
MALRVATPAHLKGANPGLGREMAPLRVPGGRRLVVVSNREPYVHRRRGPRVVLERPTGGLVAALDPVLQETGGVWIAWGSGEADFEASDVHGRLAVPPNAPRYILRRVVLAPEDVRGFYEGYANQGLWPLCHGAADKARFSPRWWKAYRAVNHWYAQVVMEEAQDDAVVWLHDYHLTLTPRALRRHRPHMFLMHFWHVPWPTWEVFCRCPQGAALLDGLLANDVIGFQLQRDVEHFLECAARAVRAGVDRVEGVVTYRGRRTVVRAFPIGIDVAAWEALAASEACGRWVAYLRHRFRLDGRLVGIGVDRLDYTKGLLERLQALDRLFRRAPALRERFVFIQKVAPSRMAVPEYRELQQAVEAEIVRLNATYGTDRWQPVVYVSQPLPPAALAALYRMADLCLVTSLQDGMNLVAKEYVACQLDLRGVLVLSQLAGAAEEIPWSIPIDPRDVEGVAEALQEALTMSPESRACRMQALRAQVARHDVYRWASQHFQLADQLLRARRPARSLFGHRATVGRRIGQAQRVAAIFDFDGTLTPLVDRPEDAVLPPQVRSLLARIAAHRRALVAVLSGRSLADLEARVGLDGICYAGHHGLQTSDPAWGPPPESVACTLLAGCCATLRRRLAAIAGAVMEDKGITATVHYRHVPPAMVPEVERIVLEEVSRLSPGQVVVRRGVMALELLPDLQWDKGRAVHALLAHALGPDWPARAVVVYAGDDHTDEDAFAALGNHGITVKVGPGPTAAHYRVRGPEEIPRLLELLAAWLEAPETALTASVAPRPRGGPGWSE